MSDVIPPTTPPAPAPRKLSKQDKLIQAYITDSEIFLDVASEDEQIRPLLGGLDYDDAEFVDALARVEAARSGFEARALGLGKRTSGTAVLLSANQTVRSIFTANASCEAGKKDSHATKLTKRGYTTAALKSLTGTAADHEETKGDTMEDTSERDAASDHFRKFMKELKGVAKGALRGRQDLLSKLGL